MVHSNTFFRIPFQFNKSAFLFHWSTYTQIQAYTQCLKIIKNVSFFTLVFSPNFVLFRFDPSGSTESNFQFSIVAKGDFFKKCGTQ